MAHRPKKRFSSRVLATIRARRARKRRAVGRRTRTPAPSRRTIRPTAELAVSFVEGLFGDELHVMRVLSVGQAVAGLLSAAALSVHAIGRGLAAVTGGLRKHGVKQVDRLLSSSGWSV